MRNEEKESVLKLLLRLMDVNNYHSIKKKCKLEK